jgi:glycogen debranching enzyme
LYPVACAPQSWAAASVFLLLQACLGLSVRGHPPQISFSYPLLPPFLREVSINNLRVGEAAVDLFIRHHAQDVSVHIARRRGKVEILTVK